MEHARTHSDLTLGVVAFSVAQRDAIEQQLELLRREDPSLEPFFSEETREPFFIKNLENVQGDERDVIFISVGYGKTAEGYLSMSFGPLNREGGERRLNVLISRSRLAMDVFSNFRAADIDLERTNARGVAALRNFLSYAETGTLEEPRSIGKEPDSEFEGAVIAALAKRGVEVDAQVGTAGFFIDIAVKDPENPGTYLLGIECDGATYHSSRSARDRDRLRQDVLEGLGWTLHRIWSTEWYRNPERELTRVLDAIERASAQRRLQAEQLEADKQTQLSSPDTIEREANSRQDVALDALAPPYRRAEISISTGIQELHELPVDRLLTAVKEIVEVESPVHVQELTRRITEAAGLKRAGSRIRAVVDKALQLGRRRGEIQLRDGFVWSTDMTTPPVRDRSQLENASKKIDWVAPEEIAEALCREVERSFTTTRQDAISGAARLLGFQRVTSAMQEVFAGQLDAVIRSRRLLDDNGNVMSASVGNPGP
jgi:very-short-patch-repair endonuclease